jgi:hypothetical protein
MQIKNFKDLKRRLSDPINHIIPTRILKTTKGPNLKQE